MRDIIRVCAMGGYVALGLFAAWRGRAGRSTASVQALNTFLIYALAVSFGAGLIQRDIWPFSAWPLVAALHPPVAVHGRVVVVDRDGHEQNADYRAWQPFVIEELLGWANARLPLLAPVDKARAADFLLTIVERGADQAARGEQPGYFNRAWGPLAAPTFLLHPAPWNSPAAVPPRPFTGLRFYEERWNLEGRRRDPAAISRTLIYEYIRR